MSGAIPPELGGLSHLEWLYLQNNQLTGTIPPELGDLYNLRSLDLQDNQLTGSIPPELGNLVTLTYLNLSTNQLQGSIPPELGNLAYLTSMVIMSNQLSGAIPTQFGNLTSIGSIQLSANQLQEPLPSSLVNLTNLTRLNLSQNRLGGPIPAWLGNMAPLESLSLDRNRLSGPIPPELGSMPNIESLSLWSNELEGTIPTELGNLVSLTNLKLGFNRLDGSIPPELGNLVDLDILWLDSNQLNGEIPAELTNLTSLYPGTGLDLRWNAVHSQESSVIAFCNAKQYLNDWQSTQTVAPDVLLIDWVGDHTVYLRWSPVSYAELGGFEGYVAPSAGGPWASAGMTESKAIREIPITTVVPGVSYDLAVTAFTLPHALNQSTVISDPSDPEMATTSDLGCPQPVIEMAWGDPAVLSLDASYDSHAWSTGEITPTIEVSPHEKRFYWVSVTSPGSCHDSAIILVDPGEIFDDGFESGNVSAWSS